MLGAVQSQLGVLQLGQIFVLDVPVEPGIVTEVYLLATVGGDVWLIGAAGADVALSGSAGGDLLVDASVGEMN